MEPLFDRPARQVLADARRAMEANRNKVSGDLDGPNEFGPETSQEGQLKPRVSATGEERRDEWEIDAGGVVGFDSRIKGDEMRPPATNADSYLKEFTAVTEGRIIDARWIFEARLSGSPRPLDAQAGQVVPFPAWAVRREWAW